LFYVTLGEKLLALQLLLIFKYCLNIKELPVIFLMSQIMKVNNSDIIKVKEAQLWPSGNVLGLQHRIPWFKSQLGRLGLRTLWSPCAWRAYEFSHSIVLRPLRLRYKKWRFICAALDKPFMSHCLQSIDQSQIAQLVRAFASNLEVVGSIPGWGNNLLEIYFKKKKKEN